MIDEEVRSHLLSQCVNAAVKAGAEIMKIYKNSDDYAIGERNDKTPITIADRLAHKSIKESLGCTRIPILSEEGREMLYAERCNWELFWLVDPLDGTLEFIKGNNEFTVNIALMENNRAIGGVIYVPYLHKLYISAVGFGSYMRTDVEPDGAASYTFAELMHASRRLPLAETAHENLRIGVSRSHKTPELFDRIAELRQTHPDLEVVEQGSSYKFCMLAEGSIDYYLRTTQTYEWDTAAGELILNEAGGSTTGIPSYEALRYNKEDLHNPWFECRSHDCRIQ